MPLAAETLESRAMLATTATLSGDLSGFTQIPVTFLRPDGSVGFSRTAYVGQLGWSAMTGDAAAAGVPAAFKSFCIEGLQSVAPGTNSFAEVRPLAASSLLGATRSGLLADFWRQYGPADAAGFADKTDSAAFQLAVWEIINDGLPVGTRLASDLATGQFSVAAAGRTVPAALRAAQWLAGFDTTAPGKTAVALHALQSPTRQDQVVCVPLPNITVQVSPANVAEDGPQKLTYTFTASAASATPIVVNYAISGTATAASDFTGLPAGASTGVITIPANSSAPGSAATLTITPTPDTVIEFDETVVISLLPGTGYTFDTTRPPATGTIENDDYRLDLILDGLPEETAPEPNELSPGAFLPIGGGRTRLDLIVESPGYAGTVTLFVTTNADVADAVTLWDSEKDGTQVLPTTWQVGQHPRTLWVETTDVAADIQFIAMFQNKGTTKQDAAKATAIAIDLDIDSNNNDGLKTPKRDEEEEKKEPKTPKKLVVNDNDTDGDHVPDYADWSIPGKRFTPLVIEIPAGPPLASMQLTVSYTASDPALIGADRRVPADSAERPLRIWTKNAGEARNTASVTAGGSFVPADRIIEDLSTLGFTDTKRIVELYVEGIHTTAGVSQPISIQLTVGGRATTPDLVNVVVVSNTLVIGIDGTGTKQWLTGPNAKRENGLWNSHVANLIADIDPYAMTIYTYGPSDGPRGWDSDDIQRDVVARANDIIKDAGGGTKVALVGWSRGAMIALWVANELSAPVLQVIGMQRTVEFVGLYDPVDMSTAIPDDQHGPRVNAARIQPGIRRVTIVGPKETPNNNVDYPVGLPSYWLGLILTPDPVFVRMSQNDRITALGGTTVVTRIEYNASHGAIGGCPGYNVHLVSIPDGRYDYALDVERSILSDTDIRDGLRAAGLDFVPDRGDPDEDWYGFPTIRPVTR
jgi:hypothetical protein